MQVMARLFVVYFTYTFVEQAWFSKEFASIICDYLYDNPKLKTRKLHSRDVAIMQLIVRISSNITKIDSNLTLQQNLRDTLIIIDDVFCDTVISI